jgi:hypothetical protein
MNKQFIIGLLLMGALTAGQAAIYYQGTGVTGDTPVGTISQSTIYDGNPAYVIANSMNLSSYAAGNNWSLSSLTITLNISGGMNNGLYGYLVGPDGTTVTLLNQPGYAANGLGAYGAGMNITLQASGAANGNIQDEIGGSPLSGAYNAAGLSGFNGLNPNGTWTLYFSDTLAGGGNATLNGWSLDITAVPEPVNMALGVFGGILALSGARQWWLKRRADRAGITQP